MEKEEETKCKNIKAKKTQINWAINIYYYYHLILQIRLSNTQQNPG